MNTNIPENEVGSVLHVFWVMLKELEAIADSKGDPYYVNVVAGACRLLDRAGIVKDCKPVWVQRELDKKEKEGKA